MLYRLDFAEKGCHWSLKALMALATMGLHPPQTWIASCRSPIFMSTNMSNKLAEVYVA